MASHPFRGICLSPGQAVELFRPVSLSPGPAARRPEPAGLSPSPVAQWPEPAVDSPGPVSLLPGPAAHSPGPAGLLPEPAVHPPEPAGLSPGPANASFPFLDLPPIFFARGKASPAGQIRTADPKSQAPFPRPCGVGRVPAASASGAHDPQLEVLELQHLEDVVERDPVRRGVVGGADGKLFFLRLPLGRGVGDRSVETAHLHVHKLGRAPILSDIKA